MRAIEIPGFDQLTAPEKLLLVEDIWDAVSSDDAAVPVPDSHIKELRERLASHRASPGQLLTLDELKQGIASRR